MVHEQVSRYVGINVGGVNALSDTDMCNKGGTAN